MTEVPVYLFTGFLESGKTLFIQDTLEDKRFNNGEKTLLLVCEEGEEEYDRSRFSSPNVTISCLTEKEDFTEEKLAELLRQAKATRVVVEYNGMWMVKDFFEAMPEGWAVYQTMLFMDSNTAEVYNQNMRSLVVDKLQNTDCVIFNRMQNGTDIMPFHKIVRGVSRRTEIIYDYTDGHIQNDEIEDPLPFDINASVITIEDRDFALWYRDITEEMKKYEGKTVRCKVVCATGPKFPNGIFVSGRHIMTCCAADITYCGFVSKWENADTITNGQWMNITAKIDIRFSRLYGKKGPILNIVSAEPAEAPEEQVATFY